MAISTGKKYSILTSIRSSQLRREESMRSKGAFKGPGAAANASAMIKNQSAVSNKLKKVASQIMDENLKSTPREFRGYYTTVGRGKKGG
jgi:hypothetical protein